MKTTYEIMEVGTSYPFLSYNKAGNRCVDMCCDLDEELTWEEYDLTDADKEDFNAQLEALKDIYHFSMDDVAKCKAYIHEHETEGTIVLIWE